MRTDPRNVLIIGLLVVLAWQLVAGQGNSQEEGGGGDANRDVIAVTGAYGSGASALYLFDTRTRHLAVYRLKNGRRLELMAARDCLYDFYLESYHDDTEPGLQPRALRRGWQEFNRKSGAKTETRGAEETETGTRKGRKSPDKNR